MATRSRTAAQNPAAKANSDEATVEFRGQKFTFPLSRAKWPTRAHQAFQRKNNADGIEYLLGPAQWERLNTIAPSMEEFWEFFGTFLATVNKPAADKDDKADKDDEDGDGTAAEGNGES
ncbi:hypothetical protein A5722_14590 [Mycobacterium vulneris]|nr:hypothetical protein A5722_14590 [Mycolicibacterium vulneris]OCB66159.1 hypothetical protein A5729_12095 [Mycolicibacterium vulneris]